MEYIAIDKELYNEIVATVSTASQEIREEYRLYQESIGCGCCKMCQEYPYLSYLFSR